MKQPLPVCHFFRLFGSLRIAVPLLIAIATVLAWGTIYETRFGTAAVQRSIDPLHSSRFYNLLSELSKFLNHGYD